MGLQLEYNTQLEYSWENGYFQPLRENISQLTTSNIMVTIMINHTQAYTDHGSKVGDEVRSSKLEARLAESGLSGVGFLELARGQPAVSLPAIGNMGTVRYSHSGIQV